MEREPHPHMKLWIYDLHINLHFTLKENTLKRVRSSRTCPVCLDTLKVSVPPAVKRAPASADLDDSVACR